MTKDASSEELKKLLIDDSSDFVFHAAYLVYLKVWSENPDDGIRLELNKSIQSLAENKEYSTFYKKINQYRKDVSSNYSDRSGFKAQRKGAWRKNEAKRISISRHKK